MKILLITDLFPVDKFDVNTPETLLDFVSCWKDSGHQVKVLRPNFLFNSFLRKKKFYKSGWYNDVYNVNYWLPFLGNIKGKLKDFYDVNFEPDIVISHMPSGTIFADKLRLNFSACIHCSDIEVLTNPVYSIYFKTRLKTALISAEKVFCRSIVLKNKICNLYPEFNDKTYLALSGINEKYIIENIERDIDMSNLKICTCANLIKRKNIDKLIYAVKDFPDIILTVIGDGVEINKLKKISKNTVFTGKVPHEKVFEIMREHDIFILPSINETFGMVYLEAMASGCIPVCTKNDGIDGIIQNGVNGFTVEADSGAIRELIQKISDYNYAELNIIRHNALKTAKKYTQKSCGKQYFEQLIPDRK